VGGYFGANMANAVEALTEAGRTGEAEALLGVVPDLVPDAVGPQNSVEHRAKARVDMLRGRIHEATQRLDALAAAGISDTEHVHELAVLRAGTALCTHQAHRAAEHVEASDRHRSGEVRWQVACPAWARLRAADDTGPETWQSERA
jgi:hypothetical protein